MEKCTKCTFESQENTKATNEFSREEFAQDLNDYYDKELTKSKAQFAFLQPLRCYCAYFLYVSPIVAFLLLRRR